MFANNRNTLHTTFLNGYLLAISQENITQADYFQQVIERHFYEENETYFRIVYLFAQGLFERANRRGAFANEESCRYFPNLELSA